MSQAMSQASKAGLSKTGSSVVNAVLYQCGWFACVLGAAAGRPTLGAAAALVLIVVHLALSTERGREWPLLIVAAGLGLTLDTLHARFGILEFAGHEAGALAPLWVLALWLQFGTALHFSLRWLSGRYLLASLLGLIGGPLAFLGGERLGAAVFGEPRSLSLAILGLSWAAALPLLVRVADRFGSEGRYGVPTSRTVMRQRARSQRVRTKAEREAWSEMPPVEDVDRSLTRA